MLGIAVFGAGVAAVFTTENGTGAAALLAIGAAFSVVAVLGDRVQSVELGGVNLTLRDIARETFALAKEAEQRGDDTTAQRLRTVANELDELASEYRRLRRAMRSGPERTRALEHVVTEAASLSRSDALEPVDVATWFDEGTPEARITALGLMQGNPRLRDFDAALHAIENLQSAFEQYHGLHLAEMTLPELTRGQRAELTVVVERALRSFGYAATATGEKPEGASSER
ncbi:MAG: hypothetical protein H0T69_10945 [Thermoleophilaceae bacterium]|nr:hypothetical protein [Thermoleophilaceae bacterium]